MAEDYTPRYTGDTSDPWNCTFTDHLGNPYQITGATNLTLKLRNKATGVVIVGGGSFAITPSPNNNTALYTWVAADVGIASFYDVSVSMTLSNGKPKHFDFKVLEIRAIF